LLAGYGELELLLAFCVGTANASRTTRKPGQQIGEHRIYHENQAIKDMFRKRGESNRFKMAKKRMNKVFAAAGLKGDYIETMGAMHQCLKIRNLFAHCHWAQSKKRGLFFINLEDEYGCGAYPH
jgi:thermostable 8-oxoguanine DNA glycosylase